MHFLSSSTILLFFAMMMNNGMAVGDHFLESDEEVMANYLRGSEEVEMTKGLAVDRSFEADEKENRDILSRVLSDESELRMKVATFVNHLVEYFLEEKTKNAKNQMNLSRNKLDSSQYWSGADLSSYWSYVIGEGNEIKTFKTYTKETYKQCTNVGCFMNANRLEFAMKCSRNSECDGFTFTTGKPLTGSGCMKKCGNDDSLTNSKTHDYWEKENQGTEVYAIDSDDLMATNWDKNIKYWRDLADEVQDSTLFQSIKISIKVYFIKMNAKTFGTNKEDYGIVALARDNSKNRWVIFPGAQGIQLHYGTEGDYRNFALAGQKQKSANKVHRNYFNEFRATRFIMREFLRDATNKVIFTGHSKGGLQAAHAAYYMTTEKSEEFQIQKNKVELYVFGAPNLGNENVSKEISQHVEDFGKALWYTVRRVLKCGEGTYYSFHDIIAYDRFKYHRSGGDIDWIKAKREYFPRGISEKHDFYLPRLSESKFEWKHEVAQLWICGHLDRMYSAEKMGWPVPEFGKEERWDYELDQRVRSHQLSYYLTSQD